MNFNVNLSVPLRVVIPDYPIVFLLLVLIDLVIQRRNHNYCTRQPRHS